MQCCRSIEHYCSFVFIGGCDDGIQLAVTMEAQQLFFATCAPQCLSFLMLVNDAVEIGLIASLDTNDGESSEVMKKPARINLMVHLFVN